MYINKNSQLTHKSQQPSWRLLKIMLLLAAAGVLASCSGAIVGGAVAAGGTGAAVATDARGAGTVVDDQQLSSDVEDAVEDAVPNGSFTIASYEHKILLAGQVPTKADKKTAQEAAINTPGVREVWGFLTVGHIETAAEISKDTYITSMAKTRLVGQKGVNANNIKVVTSNGIVYLLGKDAGKKHQLRSAIAGIKSIAGVKKVVSLIGK